MQILVVARWPLSIEEVAEILCMDCENELFDREYDKLGDPMDILEICSSLVSLCG